jgi:hypothetical protein
MLPDQPVQARVYISPHGQIMKPEKKHSGAFLNTGLASLAKRNTLANHVSLLLSQARPPHEHNHGTSRLWTLKLCFLCFANTGHNISGPNIREQLK